MRNSLEVDRFSDRLGYTIPILGREQKTGWVCSQALDEVCLASSLSTTEAAEGHSSPN